MDDIRRILGMITNFRRDHHLRFENVFISVWRELFSPLFCEWPLINFERGQSMLINIKDCRLLGVLHHEITGWAFLQKTFAVTSVQAE